MMGGIIVKYFPQCYHFEESALNCILPAALAIRECRQTIEEIEWTAVQSAQGKDGGGCVRREGVGSTATVGESLLSPC